jgi:hypothetical protein
MLNTLQRVYEIRMRKMTRSIAAAVALIVGMGCGSDPTGPTQLDDDRLFWALVLNHQAVTLSTVAPHNTIQLVATPRNWAGAALDANAKIHYRVANNDTSVLVDRNGLVLAHAPKTRVLVIATATLDGITLSDTTYINVTTAANPRPFTTFQLEPSGSVGTTVHRCNYSGFGGPTAQAPRVVARMLDDNDAPIANSMVYFWSSDPTLLTVDPITGVIEPTCAEGIAEATVYATATIYGITYTDSLRYTIRPPLGALVMILQRNELVGGQVTMQNYFSPGTVTIDKGGIVVWQQQAYIPPGLFPGLDPVFERVNPIDVIFDDPAAALAMTDSAYAQGVLIPLRGDAGNIAAFAQDTTVSPFSIEAMQSRFRVRRFTTPGTYTYRSTLSRSTGTIIVTP